ncbi:GNAT family N-acetyltransferase [Kitasatospora sp. NPDC096147]|uniref:GNAT family N-acetyltransferase n=1 Tax=Kitasatospora sp. NPDC096147 TaxID=3364093 RepID=UPI00380FA4EC
MQGQPAHPAARHGRAGRPGGHPVRLRGHRQPGGGPVRTATPAGEFELRPVRPDRDLALLTGWMNDPAVSRYWELAGPPETTAAHLAPQLAPGSHSTPYLGLLDGAPVSYWELYRAEADRLAGYYRAEPGDTGLHLLIGPPEHRGRGLGAVLLTAVADALLAAPGCERLVAEPDLGNAPSLRAFERAGFAAVAELDLPEKRAALMLRQ